MTIRRLNTVDTISPGDLVPTYSNVYGNDAGITWANVISSLGIVTGTGTGTTTQYSTPATGANVKATPVNTGEKVWLLLTPAATLATLTITLLDSPVDQQEVNVTTTQTITALTVAGNGKTVLGAPTTLSANGFFTLRYDAVNQTYYRVA